jgi:hypothetical protein
VLKIYKILLIYFLKQYNKCLKLHKILTIFLKYTINTKKIVQQMRKV